MPSDTTDKNAKTLEMLNHAHVCVDWLSVHNMALLTMFSRRLLPRGFWGDRHDDNISEHPHISESRIYLTFDDGPSPHTTPWILEMLEEHSIQASFFLIGQEAEKHPELVQAIYKAGHSIGNHSYSHAFLPGVALKELEREIEQTNSLLESITGERPRIFRPPYGMMDYRASQVLSELEMHPVYWSHVTDDWKNPGANRVARRLLMRMKPGSLIVLHEGKDLKEQTLAAANEIIYRCKSSELKLEKVQLRA